MSRPESGPAPESAGSSREERSHIEKKTPQELAAQLRDAWPDFAFVPGIKQERGEKLEQKFEKSQDYITKLLETGADEQVLKKELDRLYQEGLQLGLYTADQGPEAQGLLEGATEYYRDWNYEPEQAAQLARKALRNRGYLPELRRKRRELEQEYAAGFSEFNGAHALSSAEEKEKIDELRSLVRSLDDPTERAAIRRDFPDGNFLYHGTKAEQGRQILTSGRLSNVKALKEKLAPADETGSKLKTNSGYEGISWSLNNIDALPGDRFHLLGFLASPRQVLKSETQLAVPSRPAPHELILIDRAIESKKFYELKTQHELLIDVGMAEHNSVLSNLATLSFVKSEQQAGRAAEGRWNSRSMLLEFSRRSESDEELAELLRTKYKSKTDGQIEFDPDLLSNPELPVGAVWLQALIDSDRLQFVDYFETTRTVREAITIIDDQTSTDLKNELFDAVHDRVQQIDQEEAKISALEIPLSELHLVIPNKDLERWLGVLARTDSKPQSIIVYDHKKVRMENFASIHRGDNAELTRQIRRGVPETDQTVQYDGQLLGRPITADSITGFAHHLLAERVLRDRKSLKLDTAGQLFIE